VVLVYKDDISFGPIPPQRLNAGYFEYLTEENLPPTRVPSPIIMHGTCCSHIREPTLNALRKSRSLPSSVSLFAIVFVPYNDLLKALVSDVRGYDYKRSVRSYRTSENHLQSFKSSEMSHVDLSAVTKASEKLTASILTV
jgi:hypothetical protein